MGNQRSLPNLIFHPLTIVQTRLFLQIKARSRPWLEQRLWIASKGSD